MRHGARSLWPRIRGGGKVLTEHYHPLHGYCWETFYIFAYRGLMGNPHLTAIFCLLPFQRQPGLCGPSSKAMQHQRPKGFDFPQIPHGVTCDLLEAQLIQFRSPRKVGLTCQSFVLKPSAGRLVQSGRKGPSNEARDSVPVGWLGLRPIWMRVCSCVFLFFWVRGRPTQFLATQKWSTSAKERQWLIQMEDRRVLLRTMGRVHSCGAKETHQGHQMAKSGCHFWKGSFWGLEDARTPQSNHHSSS